MSETRQEGIMRIGKLLDKCVTRTDRNAGDDGYFRAGSYDPAAEWQAGYEAGVEAAAKALEADAKRCDCSARNEDECACGAWCEWKYMTSARAVEIVRKLADTQ